MDRDDIGRREQLGELHRAGAPGERDVGATAGVDDRHPEPEPAARDRVADPAEPDDPERRAGEVDAEQEIERPALPLPRADQPLALAEPARGGEDQREREVGGRLGQDVGRVGDRDAERGRGGDVDVVGPDRGVGDDPEPRGAVEHLGRDRVARQADQRVGARDRRGQIAGLGADDLGPGWEEVCQLDGQRRGSDDDGHEGNCGRTVARCYRFLRVVSSRARAVAMIAAAVGCTTLQPTPGVTAPPAAELPPPALPPPPQTAALSTPPPQVSHEPPPPEPVAPRRKPKWTDPDPIFGDSQRIDGDEAGDVIAFTFDDGPDERTTPAVLDALATYDVPATFFVVTKRITGERGAGRRALLDRIVAEGHAIG